MKTTIEIPDALLRQAKSKAAQDGQSLKQFFTDALREKLNKGERASRQPEWMQGFGKLKRLSKETALIQARIDEEFEVIEPEDRL